MMQPGSGVASGLLNSPAACSVLLGGKPEDYGLEFVSEQMKQTQH